MNPLYTPTFLRAATLSLVFHLVAAYFSSGFHHYDEHFQIIEFANFKLGHTSVSQLPWEYQARVRPWFQPGIAYGIIRGLNAMGLESPFVITFILRLFSGLLGWGALFWLARGVLLWIKDPNYQKWALYSTFCAWFLPYLNVRFSSESFSTAFFIYGLMLLVSQVQKLHLGLNRNKLALFCFLAGLCLGAAFNSRYQVGIMVAGLLIWALKYAKLPLRAWLAISAGLFIAVGTGTLFDYWGYGELVFTPYRYLYENLVMGRAASFGVTPWWDYIRMALERGIPPLSLLLVITPLATWILKPKLSLTWVTLPFVLIHMMIGHKEFRFLFPIAALLAPMFFLSLENFLSREHLKPAHRTVLFFLKPGWIYFAIFFNSILLLGTSLRATRSEMGMYRAIIRSDMKALTTVGRNPYELAGLVANFYVPKNLMMRSIEASDLPTLRGEAWIFVEGAPPVLRPDCMPYYETISPWMRQPRLERLLRQTRPLDWRLFHCDSAG